MSSDISISAIHTIPAVIPDGGGPSYSVVRLCESLIDRGASITLATLDWSPLDNPPGFLKAFPRGRGPARLGRSPAMYKWLKEMAHNSSGTVFHNHSLWMMPNVYPGLIKRHSNSQLVVSPRGTLSTVALKINNLQKSIFWHAFQNRAIRNANCFHATAHSEYLDIRNSGFSQPVCVLPNGIDVPPLLKQKHKDRKQLLFIGRIHKIKGLENLLHAWESVYKKFPDWDLHIIGPDGYGYLKELKVIADRLHIDRVAFRGPLYGAEKLEAYRRATVCVLPTFSENFGMTVAESLAAGTPTIVTKGAPWDGLDKHNAGWWIDIGIDPLVDCLESVFSMPDSLIYEMGKQGHEWMLSDFSWGRIAEDMSSVYKWLLHGGVVPDCVHIN